MLDTGCWASSLASSIQYLAFSSEERFKLIRKAFLMTLRPRHEDEYQRRHNPIWPELQDVLKQSGVHNYSIFLDRDNSRLFAYAEIESEERWQQIAQTEVCQRWWRHMKDLMLTNEDNSPVATILDEVFHLD
jgi:L-rhamnose mutarotase